MNKGHKILRILINSTMIIGMVLLVSCAPKNKTVLGIPQNIWVQLTPDQQDQIRKDNVQLQGTTQQAATPSTPQQNMPMLPPQ